MTRIYVIKRRYLFLALAALVAIIVLIAYGISRNKDKDDIKENTQETISTVLSQENEYVPGLYTGEISLGSYNVTLEILVDDTRIKEVKMTTADDSVSTMYPLAGSCIDEINNALRSGTEPEELKADESKGYTYSFLLDEIEKILSAAEMQ